MWRLIINKSKCGSNENIFGDMNLNLGNLLVPLHHVFDVSFSDCLCWYLIPSLLKSYVAELPCFHSFLFSSLKLCEGECLDHYPRHFTTNFSRIFFILQLLTRPVTYTSIICSFRECSVQVSIETS